MMVFTIEASNWRKDAPSMFEHHDLGYRPDSPTARFESCTLKHLAREKIVNHAVNFVKKSD
jgi:hypothetical protein